MTSCATFEKLNFMLRACRNDVSTACLPSDTDQLCVLDRSMQCPVQLLASGRTVVAAVRSDTKADILAGAGDGSSGRLFVRTGVDITDEGTLTSQLLQGVSQIAVAVGPVFGRTQEGQMGCAPDIDIRSCIRDLPLQGCPIWTASFLKYMRWNCITISVFAPSFSVLRCRI